MSRTAVPSRRKSHVAEDRPLAQRVGVRLRKARLEAGLTQAQLAAPRYTKAYVSALENGLSKPSMAALNYFADRLQLPMERFISDEEPAWTRLEADLLLASGDWIKAADAYEELLASDASERSRAELQLGLAEAYARQDRGKEAVRVASEAGEALRRQGRLSLAAGAMYWEAYGLYELEQGDQSAAVLNQLLASIASGVAVEPDLHVRTLIALAAVTSRDEEPERALAYLERARVMVDDLDDRKRGLFLFSLATSYHELGDYEAAISTGMQSLARFRAAEADGEAASLENELAMVHLAMGNLKAASKHAATARDHFEQAGDRRWLAHVTETESQIALAAGKTDAASKLASEALALADETGDRKAAIGASLTLAKAQRANGESAAAAATLERTAELARDLGRRGQLQSVLAEWSDVLASQGDLARAYELSREALDAGRY